MKRFFISVINSVLLLGYLTAQDIVPQQQAIVLQGIVIDAETLIPLSGTQVIINRIFRGISTDDGRFAFSVIRGDTVLFSRLGYKGVQMHISDTLNGNEFIAGIYMKADTLLAGEIVIVPRTGNLKSDIIKPRSELNTPLENAKYNLAVSAYQARVNQNQLGDPAINYQVIRQQLSSEAYTKGQIPPDKMVGVSPLLLIPAAYLLMNGLPEKPVMKEPSLSDYEIDQLHHRYLQSKRK